MKLGPLRLAAFTAKLLPEGNHCGKEQQPYTFWCKGDTATIGTVGDPTVDDSEDSIPSLVDHSLEHRDGERPEAVPSEQFPAYMPPCTQVFGYDDRALRLPPYVSGTGSQVSRWADPGYRAEIGRAHV